MSADGALADPEQVYSLSGRDIKPCNRHQRRADAAQARRMRCRNCGELCTATPSGVPNHQHLRGQRCKMLGVARRRAGK